MVADTTTPIAVAHGAPALKREPVPRPPERAQLVWRRAVALANPGSRHDRSAQAIDLLRAAHHDAAAMAHASALGRNHLRAHADDVTALEAGRILEAAMAFLGARPHPGDVAGAEGR